MIETYLDPERVHERFSPNDLVGQFLLSQSRPDLDWHCDSIGGWHLAVEVHLPKIRIRSAGEPIGWLLGQAIALDGQIVAQDFELPLDDIEEAIYALGGRFLVILPLLGRVYLDPCGLLSAVFCAHRKLVASTSSLIPLDQSTAFRTGLIRAMGIPFRGVEFPSGMTSRENIERILPNHYLDLTTWKTVRHWPRKDLRPIEDVSAAAVEVADIAKREFRAVYGRVAAVLNLTAGQDSRALLACSRAFASRLECLTFDNNDVGSRTDIRIAEKVARLAGVGRHRVLGWKEPKERALALWLYRTGYSVGEPRGWQVATTVWEGFDPACSMIFGTVVDFARGTYGPDTELPRLKISAEWLLANTLAQPASIAIPETLERTRAWMDAAPVDDPFQLLDLFFLEHRYGSWAGVWAYAADSYNPVFPLAHRRAIELFRALPEAKRRSETFEFDIIRNEWPELMEIPFNPPTFKQRAKKLAGPMYRRLKRWTGAGDPKASA